MNGAAAADKILMVLTSHAQINGTDTPTGLWFEELAVPYYAFIDAGAQVEIASIRGGEVPVDPRSIKPRGENPAAVDRFMADEAAMAKLHGSVPAGNLDAERYEAVFLPGGHGTMWDLPDSSALASIIGEIWRRGGVVSAVCHGPAGLVNVADATGRPIVAGRRVSAFTNTEENAVGLTDAVPFLLETRLRALGAEIEKAPDFTPHAVADGNLVTGQNPASSALVARLVLERLAVSRATAAAE